MIATISKVTIHLADGNGNAYLVEFKDAYDEDSAVYKLTDGTRVKNPESRVKRAALGAFRSLGFTDTKVEV